MGEGKGTFADDFLRRLQNTFRPKFIENVHSPIRLADSLQCLDPLDWEIVEAQQKQMGATHAAGVLYDRLVRKTNWIEDTIRALKEKAIGLEFLAEELEKILDTVEVHWDISNITDDNGKACFNGHCSVYNFENETGNEFENMSVEDSGTSPVRHNNKPDNAVNKTSSNQSKTGVEIRPKPIETNVKEDESTKSKERPEQITKETIELRREDIRNKLMDKIYSFIQKPADLQIAYDYMEKFDAQIYRTDRGSVVFSVRIGSLEALQEFERLWRYGGLKKLLDKEMLGDFMIKELKKVALEYGHPVYDICSELRVSDADLERCRSWLVRKEFDIQPFGFVENILQASERRGSKPYPTDIAKYAADRLPEELQALLEDPFVSVSDRISKFYESEMLEKAFNDYQNACTDHVSVAQCFINWLNDEITEYFTKGLNQSTKHHMLAVAIYLVHQVESGETPAIRNVSESLPFTPIQRHLKTESSPENNFWFDITLPSDVIVDSTKLQEASQHLLEKGILYKSKGQINFLSSLLRDICVTIVVLRGNVKESISTIAGSFEYVQTLLGMGQSNILPSINQYIEGDAIANLSFKTKELRDVFNKGRQSILTSIGSPFYNQDLIYGQRDTIDVTKGISEAGNKLKRKIITSDEKRLIEVDLSVDENVAAALHWLNIKTVKVGQYRRTIVIKNKTLTNQDLEAIGHYLNVTPEVTDLRLPGTRLETTSFGNMLKSGCFRNISHLNISGNTTLKGSTRSFGLMYIRELVKLDIQNCNLGDDGMKMLAGDLKYTGKLRELNVANNNMSSKGLLELPMALSPNKRLTELRIQKNYIGKDGSFILAKWLEDLLLLEVLNISECGLGDEGSLLVASSLVSRSLRKLSMRSNNISADGSRKFFQRFRCSPHLDHLDFSSNTLFPVVYTTKYLSIDAHTSDPFVEFLQRSAPMCHLSLWDTGAGRRRLFSGVKQPISFDQMTYLCLQENNIDDDFAMDLSICIDHSENKYLEHVNLRQNKIGSLGATAIAKALSEQIFLKEVLLDRNEITDEGAKYFVDKCAWLPAIERIDLSCNVISQGTMAEIVQELKRSITTKLHSTGTESPYSSEQMGGDEFEGPSTSKKMPNKVHVFPRADVKRFEAQGENRFIITRNESKFVVMM